MLGGALGVYSNPKGGAEACAKFSNLVFAIILLIIAFSPTKLLAFYEHENHKEHIRFAVGDWIIMIWCVIASLFVQVQKSKF